MADGIDFRIEGLEALQSKLQSVAYDVQKKGGRFALRKAAQVLRNQARQNAASVDDSLTPESIAKNIVDRWNGRVNKQSGGADLGFRVGVLGGARDYSKYGEFKTGKKSSANPGGDTFYWRFLEFGTQKMGAKPFMRPAIDESGQAVVDKFVAEYGVALDRALRKGGKK